MAGPPDPTAVVGRFNDAINAQDLGALGRLMAEDHRFVDPAGVTVEGRAPCLAAWEGFFASFPDYRNTFDEVRPAGAGVVEAFGRSDCHVAQLAGPARWRAVVRDDLVSEWRVSEP